MRPPLNRRARRRSHPPRARTLLPQAVALPAADDAGDGGGPLFGRQAEPHAVHRLADVFGGEPREDYRGGKRARLHPRSQGEELHAQVAGALAAVQAPELPHAQVAVAGDLPFVGVRDLGLDHEIGRRALEERLRRLLTLRQRGPIAPRALADVEGAVRFHAGPRGVAGPAQARAAQAPRGTRDRAARRVHDVVENDGQVVVEARRRHQRDEPAHGVEADPAERTVPVDGRELGDRPGVRAQDVNGRAERPDVPRGGIVHAGNSAACPIHHDTARGRVPRAEPEVTPSPENRLLRLRFPPSRAWRESAPFCCADSWLECHRTASVMTRCGLMRA